MSLQEFVPNRDFFIHYAEAVLIISDKNEVILANHAFTVLTGNLDDKGIAKLASSLCDCPDFPCRIELIPAGGSNLPLKVSLSQLQLSNNTSAKVYTLSADIEKQEIRQLLNESERRFNALADASPAMIWLSDENGRVFYLNRAWLEFTGKQKEEAVGDGWKKNLHPEDTPFVEESMASNTGTDSYALEYRLKRFDGKYRNIYAITTPRFLADGKLEGYMCSCLDITEMKEAQHELTRQAKELKRSNEELEQFAYVASHDLQEPLRMIASYIQLIQKNINKGDTKGVEEFMNFVLDGVSRMQVLISDLLQLSRVIKKGNPFQVVDMNEVMDIVKGHLQLKITEAGANITFGAMPKLKGDSLQLVRLVQNLIENALKFKAPGRTPEISVSSSENETHWIFKIKDNGIGIDNKFYNRIFVIFQRLHTRNEYEGTGIGLAICKKIVERHGGDIWVESEPGHGSTFYFTITK